MDTTPIWHFDILPAHPQPEPLETLTCYLMRLGMENYFQNAKALTTLCFPGRETKARLLADYPPVSFGDLPLLAVCDEQRLLATTFHHLAAKFGRSTQPQALSRFLNGSIATRLRYCPTCVRERGYYILPWRFLALTGCPEHQCELLDHCGHCGQEIRLFTTPFRVGFCPTCGRSLADCHANPLTEFGLRTVRSYYRDLVFLLTPQPCETAAPDTGKWLGRQIGRWRRSRGLRTKDVAALLGRKLSEVRAFERAAPQHRGLRFEAFVKYTYLLHITAEQLFSESPGTQTKPGERKSRQKGGPHKVRKSKMQREQELLDQVQAAKESLRANGVTITVDAIAQVIGLSRKGLRSYPRVRAILDEVAAPHRNDSAKRAQRERALAGESEKAALLLRSQGKPVTQKAIAELVGMSAQGLFRYPMVQAAVQLVKGEAYNPTVTQREIELAHRVQQLVDQSAGQGWRITQREISNKIGMSIAGLKKYPLVKDILTRVASEQFGDEARARREQEYYDKVQGAAECLRAQGKRVTQEGIAKLIGVTVSCLNFYPAVKALLKRLSKWAKNRGKDRDLREQELVERISQAPNSLQLRGEVPTKKAISLEVGMSINGLRRYPRAWALLDRVAINQPARKSDRAQRESQLVDKTQTAIQKLRRNGLKVTQQEVANIVRLSVSALRKYHQVEAILTSIAEQNRHRVVV